MGANQHRTHLLPQADQGLSALISDLDERGLLETTLVVAMGEFGRTPKINGDAGRDHWPDCFSVVLAGGGLSGGQVYGSSDKIAAQTRQQFTNGGYTPSPEEVLAVDMAITATFCR